jgi:hypothetical protein
VSRRLITLIVAGVAVAWLVLPPGMMPTVSSGERLDPRDTRARLDTLARAKVLTEPRKTFDRMVVDTIECRFVATPVSGTTAKFDCAMADGTPLRVKYGWTSEIPAEVAATHLLTALGFGADRVVRARRVRCYGCPRWPMLTRQVAGRLSLDGWLRRRVDFDRHTDFEQVSVEWRDKARELKFGEQEGWAWHELSHIDPMRGGAT